MIASNKIEITEPRIHQEFDNYAMDVMDAFMKYRKYGVGCKPDMKKAAIILRMEEILCRTRCDSSSKRRNFLETVYRFLTL